MERTNQRIEGIEGELLALAKIKPLRGANLERVKELMRGLRQLGFTNLEVSELTGHRWREPTIKLYTRGTTASDPDPKQKATELLAALVGRGLTLENVAQAVLLMSRLEPMKLGIEDVARFVDEIQRTKVDLKWVLDVYQQSSSSGLSIAQMATFLHYRSELETVGITPASLTTIYEISKQYGGYEKVFEAMKSYANLESLRNQIANLQNSKAVLETSVKKLTDDAEQLKRDMMKMEHVIDTYNRLLLKGFDEKTLDELKRSSEKYGGHKAVLEAINEYAGLTGLQQKISSLRLEESKVEAELKKVEADKAHLLTVIEMSETLLYKQKFSPSAIADICELAKKYGEPLAVMKAINVYGEMKAIDAEAKRLTTTRDELKNRVSELDIRLQNLRGTADDIQKSIASTLESLSLKVNELPKAMASSFVEGIQTIRTKALEAGEALGTIREDVKKLKSLEIIVDLIERPAEVRIEFNRVNDLSLGFVTGLQTYVEVNKEKIRDSHTLEQSIRSLRELLTERARHGA